MSLRTILVPLSGSDSFCDTAALTSALKVARRIGAHVVALHVKLDPRSAAAFVGEGMTSAMIESVIDMAEKDGETRKNAALSLFNEICQEQKIEITDNPVFGTPETVTAEFDVRIGNREDVLLSVGRLFDLIVMCKVSTDENTSNSLVLNAALRETGRPVLIVSETIGDDFGKRIAVAWNGSVESSRAITHALPFLKAAERVMLICAVDDLDEDINPDEARKYLALHGVAANSCKIHGTSGRTTAESLMTQAHKCDADLVVMGAYTRSQLRRLFLGAVTGEVLDKCDLPTLMSH
ncbi:universal stress protein [Sneathiella chinensis]|uniref:Universal stress protein UspA n=1 Tax=Sneathiella chinensis TaxID=349750 RepID=A0ABQ5U3Q1_9PROT|nr:universal stress protein [Sneathiella chinensis]GLQ06539.1 universal stress protein UspA [Sneathiella chinensis]